MTDLSVCMLYGFDLFGTVVFAMGGALVATKERDNWFVAIAYAVLTALGGGTIRDLLLGQQPVFWMRSPFYLVLAITVGLATFYTSKIVQLRQEHCWLADIISLAIFTVVGAQATISAANLLLTSPMHWAMPPLMGLLTGTGGGIIRDLLGSRSPHFMKDPYQALNSLIGGSLYSILTKTRIFSPVTIGLSISATIGLELYCQHKRHNPYKLAEVRHRYPVSIGRSKER
ncbi:MAG: TRIC cation channel family protein [Phormidesmis sp.]